MIHSYRNCQVRQLERLYYVLRQALVKILCFLCPERIGKLLQSMCIRKFADTYILHLMRICKSSSPHPNNRFRILYLGVGKYW